MCGIIGAINFAGKYVSGMESIIRQLLWADTLRGGDATGLYAVTKDGSIDWAKQTVDGWTFCSRNERAKKILRVAEEHTFIIGHNRAATQGAHDNVDYAHPVIIEKKIGLVHNGTLSSWPQRNMADPKKRIEHDSTAIATLIAERGVQEFVNVCHGAWSLAYHDVKKNTLNLYRNEDRPMAVVHTEDAVFFGSELGLLMWVVQRNNIKPIKHYYTKPHNLYTFEQGAPEPKVEEIKKKYQDYFHQGSGNRFPPSRRPSWLGEQAEEEFAESAHAMGRPHSLVDDGDSPAVLRRRAESIRLATTLAERAAAVEQEAAEAGKGNGGSEDSGNRTEQSNVRDIRRSTKPHARPLDAWKTFVKGEGCMFSVYDYGEIVDKGDTRVYNLRAEPATSLDFPEVQIRATVKPELLPQATVQASKNYFMGEVSQIIATENGNVVIWVKDVEESGTPDPQSQLRCDPHRIINVAVRSSKSHESGEYVKKRIAEIQAESSEVFNDDEVAEATVHLPVGKDSGILLGSSRKIPLHGKNFCQCCSALCDSSKLRFLTETVEEVGSNKQTVHQLRVCETCVVLYGEDRDKVVPMARKGLVPKSTEVRKFS